MNDCDFIDFYEILGLDPDADSRAIEYAFRTLARRYHPDNNETGDREQFELILRAHDTLRDPVERVRYDLEHDRNVRRETIIIEERVDDAGVGDDLEIQRRMLTLFYGRRRRDVREPGIGNAELASLLGHAMEHIEFNLWYLEEKRWIRRLETGVFAITAEGVDRASAEHEIRQERRRLTMQS